MLNFENLDKFIFHGVGQYGIPQIEPTQEYPAGEFIPINYQYTAKNAADKIAHFSLTIINSFATGTHHTGI